jgi:alpha-methylacyl-CoA racemase
MGPLAGYKLIEIAGIGPSQYGAMLLADLGAEIIRIDRVQAADLGIAVPAKFELLNRGRRSVAVNLKDPAGVETVLKLCEKADGIFEGFRPGVMEQLGLGPEVCLKRNPRLVYGRMTGFGQTGPLAKAAGHDPNYIALTGALDAIGARGGPPILPLNIVGDFGGGGTFLALGMLAGLLESMRSGKGQVIDCAMVDGALSLMTLFYGLQAAGMWHAGRGTNILGGGSHFFGVYRTKDDKHIVIGPVENRFYRLLLEKLNITDPEFKDQFNEARWPELKEKLQAIFLTRTRAEWCELLEGTDACFSPVLTMTEAHEHRHNAERHAFIEIDGVRQPAPAPRFSRTQAEVQRPPAEPGRHTSEVLRDWGFTETDIDSLLEQKAVAQS